MTPTIRSRPTGWQRRRFPLAVTSLVAALAAVNWVQSPEQAGRWLRGMLTLPSMWLALTLWYRWTVRSRARRGVADDPAVRSYFDSAVGLLVLGIGLTLAVPYALEIWVRFAGSEDLDIERRLLGLASGAFLIVFGNALPKILTPLSMLPPGTAARQSAARRFVGLTWVVLGSILVVAFLIAPLAFARELQAWVFIASLLTVLAGIVWMNAGPMVREGSR